MTIALGLVLPHAPILLELIGQADWQRVSKTLDAYKQAAASIRACQAEVLVIIGPHGPQFSDAFTVHPGPLDGHFGDFGHQELALKFESAPDITRCLMDTARSRGLCLVDLSPEFRHEYGIHQELDYGVLVPLFLLYSLGVYLPVMVINTSGLALIEHYRLGMAISDVASSLQKKLAVIASGDLSHCVTQEAPYPYDPAGQEYDTALTAQLRVCNVQAVVARGEHQLKKAGQCGHRPITTMLGALDSKELVCDLMHYDAPFGVGYAVSVLRPLGAAPSLFPSIVDAVSAYQELKRQSEPPLVKLAREAVETYVARQSYISPPATPEIKSASAVFVSLKLNGELRGCMGTTSPCYRSLGEEIVNMAVAACSKDTRFDPVQEWELADLDYTVDVLSPPDNVTDTSMLDPRLYGIIVQEGKRKGLLLPNLDGIESVADQIEIACGKAGIKMSKKTKISRFRVERHETDTTL